MFSLLTLLGSARIKKLLFPIKLLSFKTKLANFCLEVNGDLILIILYYCTCNNNNVKDNLKIINLIASPIRENSFMSPTHGGRSTERINLTIIK